MEELFNEMKNKGLIKVGKSSPLGNTVLLGQVEPDFNDSYFPYDGQGFQVIVSELFNRRN